MAKLFHPPCFCPVHGLFAATHMVIGEHATSTFIGSTTTCPICRRQADILPGTFQGSPEGLNYFADPSISVQALSALQKVITEYQTGLITKDEAIETTKKIDPKIAETVKFWEWDFDRSIALFSLIISILAP